MLKLPDVKSILLQKDRKELLRDTVSKIAIELVNIEKEQRRRMSKLLPFSFQMTKEKSDEPLSPVRCTLKKGKQSLDLSTFLPEGFRFQESTDGVPRAMINEKIVSLVQSNDADAEKLHSALHEIGHSHQTLTQIRSNLISAAVVVLMKRLFSWTRPELRDMYSVCPRGFLPMSTLQAYHQLIADHERDAWQYAITAHANLKEAGFDALPSKKEKTAFNDRIRFSLHTYEFARWADLYISGGKKGIEAAEPLYSKASDPWNQQ